MAKKLIISICLLVYISTLISCSRVEKSKEPEQLKDCSVLLITLDSLTARYLSCYGYRRNTSPYLDKFANRHVRFTQAFSQSFYSGPSHASLLSSLYPRNHGAFRNSVWMDEEALCLQEILKANGYKTGAVVNTKLLGELFNFDQGFDFFERAEGHPERKEYDAAYNDLFWLAERWIGKNKDSKFFFWLHCNYIHSFYKPGKAYQNLWYSEEELEKMDIKIRYYHHRDMIRARGKGILTPDEVNYAKSQYDGQIVQTDELLHRFLTKVEKLVPLEDLLIIVTSDHGEIFDFRNNRFGHGHYLYEDVIHIPLIMALPPLDGRQFENLVIHEDVQGIDIAPTILDLLGIDVPAVFQGISFADFFRKQPRRIHSELILGVGIVDEPVCIRKEGWKLIYYNDEKMEVYDTKKDTHEYWTLAPSRPEQLESLLTLYKRWTRFVPHYDFAKLRQKRQKLNPEIIEILKKAGYLEDETDLKRR